MAKAPRKYSIADVLGFGAAAPRSLAAGLQREYRRMPRNAPIQGGIKATKPTATQELVQLLTPNTRAGNEFANKLAPAVDMSPIGVLTGLVDARRAYQAGNTGQAAGLGLLAALGAIPGGKGASKAGKEAIETAAERGIIAYHGSPHSFDKFALDKIGTGEGAQAYGHGLYFAENEDVAKSYRDALRADHGFSFGGLHNLTRDQVNELVASEYGGHFVDNVVTPRGISDNVMDTIIHGQMGAGRKRSPEYTALRDELSRKISNSNPGSMYQVRINADPIKFLDWDKPYEPDALEALAANFDSVDPVMRRALEDWAYENSRRGIPMPDGQDIISKFGGVTGTNARALSETLKNAGVPGIKYLDQGSRGAGKGSSNYVVFDDALIDILKKYGIAIPALAGGGLLATQPQQNGGI